MTAYNQEIQFNASAVVTLRWPDFKSIVSSKNLSVQFITRGDSYAVFAVDNIIAYVCTLVLLDQSAAFPFPDDYSQSQNDIDVADFESVYKPKANASLLPSAATGVPGQAPAKGLGGFAPDPMNNPYQPTPDEVVSLYVDGEGSLVTRGAALTDEGSLRDDFTGTSLETTLTGTLTFTNGSDVVLGSGSLFRSEVNRDHYVKLESDGIEFWAAIVRAPTDTMLQLDGPYGGSTGTGSAHKTRWIEEPEGDSPGSVTVGGSRALLSSGTASDGGVSLRRDGDYLPMISTWRASISQRIANQSAHFGFRDDCDNPHMYCDVIFDGTDDTTVKFRSAWDQDEQLSTVTLPPGLMTNQTLRYKLDVSTDYCSLLINGVLVARHDNHVPDMYSEMALCAGVLNEGATSNTDLSIDSIFWSNQDQLQISSIFHAPIPVITREDQHSLRGKLVTSSTTADQTVITYTVPDGKVCFIIGYRFDAEGPVAGLLKVGRNDLSDETESAEVLDGNIFRSLFLLSQGSVSDEFGSNPRRLGVGGDTILVTVTPEAGTTNTWRAFLDFVLR